MSKCVTYVQGLETNLTDGAREQTGQHERSPDFPREVDRLWNEDEVRDVGRFLESPPPHAPPTHELTNVSPPQPRISLVVQIPLHLREFGLAAPSALLKYEAAEGYTLSLEETPHAKRDEHPNHQPMSSSALPWNIDARASPPKMPARL